MGYCAVMWGTTGYIGSMGVLQDKGGGVLQGSVGYCRILWVMSTTRGTPDYFFEISGFSIFLIRTIIKMLSKILTNAINYNSI